ARPGQVLRYANPRAVGNLASLLAARPGVLQSLLRPDPHRIPRRRRSPLVNDAWIAKRMKHIEASGIRKAFDMSKAMKDPINLSIGLPDFDVAEPVKAAAIAAI